LQNRIELMVVATCAAYAETQKNVGSNIRDLVENIVPLRLNVALVVLVDAESIVSGRYDRVWIAGLQLIASDLLADETVVGFVIVQRTDDIVAIAPRIRAVGVRFITVGLRITNEIEPVARPMLAVARTGEHA